MPKELRKTEVYVSGAEIQTLAVITELRFGYPLLRKVYFQEGSWFYPLAKLQSSTEDLLSCPPCQLPYGTSL